MIYTHQRSSPYLYNTSPYGLPAYGTVSYQSAPLDVNWHNTWPRVRSILLSVTMIICSTAIIGLDIANIAIEANKQNGTSKLGSGTGKVGAGIWSGSISFFAAIVILMTIFMQNKRIAATFALLSVALAFFFTIALIGLVVYTPSSLNMYAARPRAAYPRAPPRLPIGYGQQIPAGDLDWKLRWPFIFSAILAVVMIVFTITIFGLEIASLAKSTSGAYGNTASVGTGIWCAPFFLIAAVLILMINCARRTKLAATFALIATIVAACFSVILIGLDAKAVKNGHDIGNLYQLIFGSYSFLPKYRVLAAQLAFACVEFILCIVFILVYICMIIFKPRGIRQPQLRK